MTDDAATIASLYRYPVKGLSPEALRGVALERSRTFPSDRRYAIENGPSGFDPAAPSYLPKTKFLMLMRDERLAALRTHFDDATQTLTIRAGGHEVVCGDLATAAGRTAIENYFLANFSAELRGPPKLLEAAGHSFSDVAKKVVSIINLASVAAIAGMVGRAVDPLRFRANIYVAGWPGWRELNLVGQTLAIGNVRLKVVKKIVRCAAVNVDPLTAARDMEIPRLMMRELGHFDCGVYAEVVNGGGLATGDEIVVAQPAMV